MSAQFEVIKQILANSSKKPALRDPSFRSFNDKDIDWLVRKVARFEAIFLNMKKVPFKQLTEKMFHNFLNEALRD